MAFFRIKKIKGNEYVYIVENEWKGKGSRQKVKGYIGRAYRLELKNDVDFTAHLKIVDVDGFIEKNDFKKIVEYLIEWELFKFCISRQEFFIDFDGKIVQKNKKNAVLLINDGFLCSITLRNLLEFKPENEETDAYRLARAFVEAGIKVPQDFFVRLFEKLYKHTEKPKSDFEW